MTCEVSKGEALCASRKRKLTTSNSLSRCLLIVPEAFSGGYTWTNNPQSVSDISPLSKKSNYSRSISTILPPYQLRQNKPNIQGSLCNPNYLCSLVAVVAAAATTPYAATATLHPQESRRTPRRKSTTHANTHVQTPITSLPKWRHSELQCSALPNLARAAARFHRSLRWGLPAADEVCDPTSPAGVLCRDVMRTIPNVQRGTAGKSLTCVLPRPREFPAPT